MPPSDSAPDSREGELLKWRVGDVFITRILEMEMPFPYSERRPFIAEATPEALQPLSWLYPHYVTPEGALRLSIHALLVEAPGLKLVVDTCIGNDRPRRFLRGQALATPFLEHMAAAGWAREDVNAVVCTHLHVDHVGWNTMLEGDRWVPTFPNARYLIGAAEYQHWRADEDPETAIILGDSIQPIFDAGLASLVEPDHRLSEQVRLTPTPGHTPGHVSVLIDSAGERAVITGDLMHHPCQMAHPDWCAGSDLDVPVARQTRRRFLEGVADQPVLVIGSHFAAPTAGHVRRDGEGYRFDD